LFPITVEGTGETAWILIVGLGNGHVSGGSGTQYFVGDFDRHELRNRHGAETELFMAWGRDYYAAQTLSGLNGEAPLAIAWMSNWRYANHTPSAGFRGSMNLPRRLQLVSADGGFRLLQRVDPSTAMAFQALGISDGAEVTPPSGTYRISQAFSGQVGSQ